MKPAQEGAPVSWIKNCFLSPRPHDPVLFDDQAQNDGRLVVRLDGYAILPIEEYNRLTELAEERADQLATDLIERCWTKP